MRQLEQALQAISQDPHQSTEVTRQQRDKLKSVIDEVIKLLQVKVVQQGLVLEMDFLISARESFSDITTPLNELNEIGQDNHDVSRQLIEAQWKRTILLFGATLSLSQLFSSQTHNLLSTTNSFILRESLGFDDDEQWQTFINELMYCPHNQLTALGFTKGHLIEKGLLICRFFKEIHFENEPASKAIMRHLKGLCDEKPPLFAEICPSLRTLHAQADYHQAQAIAQLLDVIGGCLPAEHKLSFAIECQFFYKQALINALPQDAYSQIHQYLKYPHKQQFKREYKLFMAKNHTQRDIHQFWLESIAKHGGPLDLINAIMHAVIKCTDKSEVKHYEKFAIIYRQLLSLNKKLKDTNPQKKKTQHTLNDIRRHMLLYMSHNLPVDMVRLVSVSFGLNQHTYKKYIDRENVLAAINEAGIIEMQPTSKADGSKASLSTKKSAAIDKYITNLKTFLEGRRQGVRSSLFGMLGVSTSKTELINKLDSYDKQDDKPTFLLDLLKQLCDLQQKATNKNAYTPKVINLLNLVKDCYPQRLMAIYFQLVKLVDVTDGQIRQAMMQILGAVIVKQTDPRYHKLMFYCFATTTEDMQNLKKEQKVTTPVKSEKRQAEIKARFAQFLSVAIAKLNKKLNLTSDEQVTDLVKEKSQFFNVGTDIADLIQRLSTLLITNHCALLWAYQQMDDASFTQDDLFEVKDIFRKAKSYISKQTMNHTAIDKYIRRNHIMAALHEVFTPILSTEHRELVTCFYTDLSTKVPEAVSILKNNIETPGIDHKFLQKTLTILKDEPKQLYDLLFRICVALKKQDPTAEKTYDEFMEVLAYYWLTSKIDDETFVHADSLFAPSLLTPIKEKPIITKPIRTDVTNHLPPSPLKVKPESSKRKRELQHKDWEGSKRIKILQTPTKPKRNEIEPSNAETSTCTK